MYHLAILFYLTVKTQWLQELHLLLTNIGLFGIMNTLRSRGHNIKKKGLIILTGEHAIL